MKSVKIVALTAAILSTISEINAQKFDEELSKKADKKIQLSAVPNKNNDVYRLEVYGNNLPFNSNIFMNAQPNQNLYRILLQSLPIKTGKFAFGVNGHYFQTNNNGNYNAGLGASYIDKNLQAFSQYYPTSGKLFASVNAHLFNNTKFDALNLYDHNKDFIMTRPALSYNITDNFSAGIEACFKGKANNLKKEYVGIRAQARF